MRVKNVNGSGRFSAPAGYRSWLDYWEKKTGSKAFFCSASNCFSSNLVGAHVQKLIVRIIGGILSHYAPVVIRELTHLRYQEH